MANLKPHKFTREEMAKGGRNAYGSRLRNQMLADKLTGYFTGEPPYNKGNDFVADFMSLEPKERLQFTSSVLKFVMPSLQMTTIDAVMDVAGRLELSKEERRERIEKLLKKTG